jgi:hypothetical protein
MERQTAHRSQFYVVVSQELGNLSANVEIEGGVINKATDFRDLDPASLPKFKLGPLIQDVERLLAKNGELNRIHQTPLAKVEYQLCWRCDNCGFNECCMVCAVESESIALLNLSRGEQKALGHHGIERLEDLAKLKSVMDNSDLLLQLQHFLQGRRRCALQRISCWCQADWLVQHAQYMLGGIRPLSPFANKSRWMPWLTGTGYGSLPEDSPSNGMDSKLMCSPDGMIRIYLFVERDYMLDVISMISARVNCTQNSEPLGFGHWQSSR